MLKNKSERGITLVALVITIIIIIILATVTINMAFGDNGLITQAQKAKDMTANSIAAEQEGMNSVMSEYLNVMAEDSEITPPDPPTPTDPTIEIADAKKETEGFTEKTKVIDEKDNVVMVPAGFKIAEDSGNTVQQGIVIEDVSASTDAAVQGSQYVWIQVGTFKKDDDTTSNEIKLGRYTFSTSSPGTPTLQQDAANYTASIPITISAVDYTESTIYDEGNEVVG